VLIAAGSGNEERRCGTWGYHSGPDEFSSFLWF